MELVEDNKTTTEADLVSDVGVDTESDLLQLTLQGVLHRDERVRLWYDRTE